MGKTLVLAEKPSVGKELARVLGCKGGGDGYMSGGKYVVTWALGHLVTLCDPESYDKKYKTWNMDDLPMLPHSMRTEVIRQTAKQFGVVKRLMQQPDMDELVIATDAGREGELVARWIMEKAGWRKPAKRLWISSQTDKAIREGFGSLRPAKEYDNLYKSAAARSEADWLVGLNVTRALTCKFGAQLSAGRVQTPTLALIVAREEEIRRFKLADYWTVEAVTDDCTALFRDKNGQTRFSDLAKAEELRAAVEGKTGNLTSVQREKKFQLPPAAYDLTELQRDCNRRYAYSAKQTLNIMQRLYENHKVLTYPRTDSRYITEDVAATLPDRLRAVATGEYKELAQSILRARPINPRYIVNSAKVTDHHAIIPTEEPPDFFSMTGEERNVYDLVVRRFLAVLSRPAEYEEVRVKLDVAGRSFYAKGKTIKELGWRAAYGKAAFESDEEQDDERDQTLPAMTQGKKETVRSVRLIGGKTKPPARYTEATLLTAMENPTPQVADRELKKVLEQTSGLGTPATRADIIEKLFDTFYVERRGKEIVPTSKGIQLISLVPEDLRSAELTAKWEQQLALIAKGQVRDKAFTDQMRVYASDLVEKVKNSTENYVHDNVTRSKCPDCGKFLLDVQGKKGKMLVCPDRDCGYRRSVSRETNARCPNCHKKLEMRGQGEKQMFVCACGYREKLEDFQKRRAERGADKREVARYLNAQTADKADNPLAAQLAAWQEKNKK